MAHRLGKLNLPLACICISIITMLIQTKIGSCANEGHGPTGVDVIMSPLTTITNKTATLRKLLAGAGSMDRFDLTIIPGWPGDDDFENYEPPREIAQDFPTYLSGFDHNNRPICVMELGRYKFGKYLYGGKAKQELLLKYFRFIAYAGLRALTLRSTAEKPILKMVIIFDYAGFKLETLTDRRVYQFLKKVIAGYMPYFVTYAGSIVHINLNAVSEIFVNIQSNARGVLTRHRLGGNKEEFYGTNKYEWGPKLAMSFPVDQLPEWYGGRKGFEPVYVIG